MQLLWRSVNFMHNWCVITSNLIKKWIDKGTDFSLNPETQNLAAMQLSSTSQLVFIYLKSQINSICQAFLDSVSPVNTEESYSDATCGTIMKAAKERKAFRDRELQDTPCWGINYNVL